MSKQRVLQAGGDFPVRFFVLVITQGATQLIDQRHLDMVLQILPDPRQIMDHLYPFVVQVCGWTNA
ncbi:hypothetical protein D3C75_938650 [compost metagenome]